MSTQPPAPEPTPSPAPPGPGAPDASPPKPPDLPELPPVRGAGLAHVLIPGTGLWLVYLIALLIALPTLRDHDAMLWLWIAVAGFLLGFVGLAVYGWQRAAARRGSRGASQLALEEQIGRSR